MLQNLDNNFFLILSVTVFVAVILLLEGVYLTWRTYKGPEVKQIEKRLRALSAANDKGSQSVLLRQRIMSELPIIERFLYSLPRMHTLDRMLQQADLRWTVSKLLFGSAAAAAVTYLLVSNALHQAWTYSAFAALLVGTFPFLYVRRKRAKRLATLERQLPDALDLLTRALRAGHAFSSGLAMIGQEMSEPIASEFAAVADEVNYGVELQQALVNLTERVPITDLRYFVVSVLIQRDSGGNLTEVLSNLSRLIRERLKLMARVRVLSSEGRLSAWVLGIMPFALGGLLAAMNPEFMTPLWTDPIGISIIRTMLIMMVFGIIVLKKITKIRV